MTRSRLQRAGVMCAAGALLVVPFTMPAANANTNAEPEVTLPVFEDGLAQPVFTDSSTWIRQELWVEGTVDSDGDGKLDRIHVDVTRPGETETEGLDVPVVYETSPYYAGGNPLDLWSVDHELGNPPDGPPPYRHSPGRSTSPRISTSHVNTWVPRGFAVVHSESPGSGLSEGCPTTGGVNETLAPKAVIDWLNGRATGYTSIDGDEVVTADWSTGKVGMTGTSYNGTLPIAAATTGVEGLEAIVPVAAISEWYEYYRSNGMVRAAGGYQGEDADSLAHYVHTRPDREPCAASIEALQTEQDRATGDYNEFWHERSYMKDVENIKAATLFAHGLSDWNVKPKQAVQLYEALKEQGTPTQIYLHQGGHGGAPPDAMMNKWFTRYLYDIENGVEDDPRSWVTREGDPRTSPTPYADFPNPATVDTTLNLQAGGDEVGGLALLSPDEGLESLIDNAQIRAQVLAAEQASENRLVYKTPTLVEPLHLSGTPEITVTMAADREAVNLSILLFSTNEAGRVNIVTRGWADPQNHEDLRGPGSPLTPGEFVDVTFTLEPDDTIIPAGEELGLMVFSSDYDYTIRPAPGAELTVDLAETSLTLPVVGGPLALAVATDQVAEYSTALLDDLIAKGSVSRAVAPRLQTYLETALRMAGRGNTAQAGVYLDRFEALLDKVSDESARNQLAAVIEALRPS